MANFAFDSFRNQLWGSGTHVDFAAETIKAIFVDHSVTTPLVTHDFMNDLTGAFVPLFASGVQLTSPTIGTVAVGTFDAADTVFTSLSGLPVESLILFKLVTVESDSPLLLRWDTATGLPLTPNGANVTVAWNASGIASIS